MLLKRRTLSELCHEQKETTRHCLHIKHQFAVWISTCSVSWATHERVGRIPPEIEDSLWWFSDPYQGGGKCGKQRPKAIDHKANNWPTAIAASYSGNARLLFTVHRHCVPQRSKSCGESTADVSNGVVSSCTTGLEGQLGSPTTSICFDFVEIWKETPFSAFFRPM